jgi:hypothetical protein
VVAGTRCEGRFVREMYASAIFSGAKGGKERDVRAVPGASGLIERPGSEGQATPTFWPNGRPSRPGVA